MQGRGRDAEFLGGVGDGEQFALGLVGVGLVAGDGVVEAQGLHAGGGEGQAAGGAPALPVEDPGDRRVGVVDSEAADEVDGVLVGADRGLAAPASDGQFGERAALPADEQVGVAGVVVAHDGDLHVIDQGPQQLLAVAVGGRGRVPDLVQVVPECADAGAFGVGQGAGAGLLAAGEFGLGGGEFGQCLLPGGLQAAGDEPVVRVDGLVAALGAAGVVTGAFDLAAVLVEGGVVGVFEVFGGGEAGGERLGGQRGQERVGDGGVERDAADVQVTGATAVDDRGGALAVVARGGLGRALVEHGEFTAAGPAGRQALEQGAALPDGTGAGLVGCGTDVLADLRKVGLVGVPVDVALVVVADQDLPLAAGDGLVAGAHGAVLAEVGVRAGAAVDVGAGVGRVGQNGVDGVVGRLDPRDLRALAGGGGVAVALERQREVLLAQPQPDLAHRADLAEPAERRGDHPGDRLVRVAADLAFPLGPDQADGQRAAQLAARGLVADPAVEPGPQGVQLGLGHGALQPEQHPVVEHPRVVDAVGVGDQRVGHPGQVQQPVPVGVVAREPGDLQSEHDPDVAERDLPGQLGEPGPARCRRAGHPQVGVDHADPGPRPAERDRPLDEAVLPGGRLPVALDLGQG